MPKIKPLVLTVLVDGAGGSYCDVKYSTFKLTKGKGVKPAPMRIERVLRSRVTDELEVSDFIVEFKPSTPQTRSKIGNSQPAKTPKC